MMTLVLLMGCTGTDLSEFVPTVKFNRLNLTDLSWEDISVDFVFDVRNPNPVDLPLERFDYGLSLSDIELLSGDSPEGVSLAADNTSEMVLPVTMNFEGIYDLVTAPRGEDNLPFRLQAGFGWETDIGPVDINVDEEGDFPSLRIPPVTVQQLQVTEVNASKAGFALDVDIDNDHGSTLDFANLDFKVKFAGVKVGVGQQDEFGSVEGAATRRLSVPFEVDYIDAAEALLALANGEKLSVDLEATSDVTTPFGVVPLTIDESGKVDVVDAE